MSVTQTIAKPITNLSDLDPEGVYSYADYLLWSFEERVELIRGKLFKMSPAPATSHQQIHSRIFGNIFIALKKKQCEVFSAPFDVRFPNPPNDPSTETFTVVQPDICVICDLKKLDAAGCKGAPDLIVEILSPSTVSKDLNEKFHLYEEYGVLEYWTVYPGENLIEIFDLTKKKYISRGKFVREDTVNSNVLKGLEIMLEDIFEE